MKRVLSLRYLSGQTKLRRTAFTLLQILAVVAIIAIFAAVLLPVIGRSRLAARRAQYDVRLKVISLALDAYRQQNEHYPQTLDELRSDKYLQDPNAFHCPNDPRPADEASYGDYYVVRAA